MVRSTTPRAVTIEDDCVAAVVEEQQRHGLPIVSDGEYRRIGYMQSFSDVAGMLSWRDDWAARLSAMGRPEDDDFGEHRDADPSQIERTRVTERLRLVRNRPLEEFNAVAQRAESADPTVTVLGPDRVLQAFDSVRSAGVYEDADAFAVDVVQVSQHMVRELRDAGCRYVHVDEPGYTSYVDSSALAVMRDLGQDPARNLTRSIEAGNAIFDAFPDLVFGVHICRGNRQSQWHREGDYEAVAEQLFGELRCDRLLLEYDTERAGSFAPLRYLNPNTVAVLGLISTKTPELESSDELTRRIEQASHYVPLDRLAISPQCGFASVIEGNLLTRDDQWRKLDLMLEVAQQVWA